MKYIDSKDIERARQWLLLEEEKCGYLIPHGENRVVVIEDGIGGQRRGRRLCNYNSPYKKYLWHTHPLTSQSYPSTEDVIKVIKPRTNDVVMVSLIFTKWGLWEMFAKSKGIISNSVSHDLNNAYGRLYNMTERGRGVLTHGTLPIVQSYINDVKYSLQEWGYEMSFTGWDTLKGGDYYMRYA